MGYVQLKWRTIPYTNGFYQISELGDIRTVNNNAKTFNISTLYSNKYDEVACERKIYKYGETEVEIPYLTYKTLHGKVTFPVSSIMYAAFYGIYDLGHENILHTDANELNNSLDNLILCEKTGKVNYIQQYKRNALNLSLPEVNTVFGSKSKTRASTGVSEYGINGIRQNVFVSIPETSRMTNINTNIINKALCEKLLHIDYRVFKKGIGPAVIVTHLIRNNVVIIPGSPYINGKKIFQYDLDGKLYCVYNNIFEASVFSEIAIPKLSKCLKNMERHNDYIWISDDKDATGV